LLDVREPEEWAIVHLPHARLVPLDTLAEAVGSLDRDA
jgi:rhodanese-related sulfurtransferase